MQTFHVTRLQSGSLSRRDNCFETAQLSNFQKNVFLLTCSACGLFSSLFRIVVLVFRTFGTACLTKQQLDKMIQTKKRAVGDADKAPAKKEGVKKPKSDAGSTDKAVKKFTPKFDRKAVGEKGKFQKKFTPGGKGGKDFREKGAEKKPFVANTPESKREYWTGLKKKQKELREQRRKAKTKDLYELSVGAKKIYETLKR